MNASSRYTVRIADWARDRTAIRSVRDEVFVHEQGIPLELEWDALDADAVHVLALAADDTPIGTARMLADGRIGRMSVRVPWRCLGVGGALLDALLEAAASRGLDRVYLHAQTGVLSFYEERGFRPYGEVFTEAGIPHRCMSRAL